MSDLPVPRRLKLGEGKHTLTVRAVAAGEEGDYGPTYLLDVEYDGNPREWRIGESLYLALYDVLEERTLPCPLMVVISGSGRDRRYYVEAVA